MVIRHPVRWFIALAYGLAWACWLPLLADRQDWVTWTVSPYLHLAGALGPAVAAIIVTSAVAGRAGLRDLARRCVAWRGRLRWLALAMLAPLALFAVAALAARIANGDLAGSEPVRRQHRVPGTAVDRLLGRQPDLLRVRRGDRLARLPATRPAPTALSPDRRRRGQRGLGRLAPAAVRHHRHLPQPCPPLGFLGFYLSLLVASLVLAWLYLRSNGSLLVLAVFHAGYDIATNTPTNTTLIPILMGAAITVAGLATIPALAKARPSTHHRTTQASQTPAPVSPAPAGDPDSPARPTPGG